MVSRRAFSGGDVHVADDVPARVVTICAVDARRIVRSIPVRVPYHDPILPFDQSILPMLAVALVPSRFALAFHRVPSVETKP